MSDEEVKPDVAVEATEAPVVSADTVATEEPAVAATEAPAPVEAEAIVAVEETAAPVETIAAEPTVAEVKAQLDEATKAFSDELAAALARVEGLEAALAEHHGWLKRLMTML